MRKLVMDRMCRTRFQLATLGIVLLVSTSACESSVPPALSVAPPERVVPGPPPDVPASATAGHIFLANADGSLATFLALGDRPAWSPDGKRVAFQRGGQVYIIDVDGSNEARVAAGGSPSWSPDGTKIAFAGSEGISVMNVDGSSVQTLVRHGFRTDTYAPWDMGVTKPVWSPDGTRIAFEHQGDGDIQPAQAYVMNADGSDIHLVTRLDRAKYAESDPSWSPDGEKIIYWSYGYGIAITDRRGGTPTPIFSGFPAVAYGTKPVWSTNGVSIAFRICASTGPLASRSCAIYTMSPSGRDARLLISNAADAAWSRDGSRIAFVGM